jgi:hypothetical protein
MSKRYKGKTCAYCGVEGSSTTADHVIARAFFFEEDRANLPQVPSCASCNNCKSELETYASAVLMIASRHIEADRYRQQMVRPRIAKNGKLQRELRLNDPPQWVSVGGVIQPMHPVLVDAQKINQLMQLIVRGLYMHHFGLALSPDFYPDASMFHPDHEAALLASVSDYFPPEVERVAGNLGRGAFIYSAARSPENANFSVWQLAWHGASHYMVRTGQAPIIGGRSLDLLKKR